MVVVCGEGEEPMTQIKSNQSFRTWLRPQKQRWNTRIFREKRRVVFWTALFGNSIKRAALFQDKSMHVLWGLALTCFPVAAAFGQTRTFLFSICIRRRSPFSIHLFQAAVRSQQPKNSSCCSRARLHGRGCACYINYTMLNNTKKMNVVDDNSSGLTALLISQRLQLIHILMCSGSTGQQ